MTTSVVAAMLLTAQAGAFGQATTTTTTKTVEVPAHTDVVVTKKTTKTTRATRTPRAHKESAEEIRMREMREALRSQQAQIDALRLQLADKAAAAVVTQQTATDAQTQAAAAAASAQAATNAAAAASMKVDSVSSSVTDLKTTTTGLTETVVTNQKNVMEAIDSPMKIHYKGVTLTPIGFFAMEGVYRERAANSDINTPLNSIPFPGANEGHVSELNFSARQSRLAGLFEGTADGYKMSAYFEGDFLGSGTTSNNNESNSYVFRQRQIWGKAETKSGFAVTGGQMWSLVTEDGKSTDARTEKLPNVIDPQYVVGFSWTRQPSLRLSQRFGDVKTSAFTMAMSLEQAQITNFTVNGAGNPTDYFFAGNGQNGGLYNAGGNTAGAALTTYANNVAPDVIVKTAYDLPKAHIEVGGIARFLRDYYFPSTLVAGTGAYTYGTTEVSHTAVAAGAFGSIRVSPFKFVDVAVQAMAGNGTGRYGTSQLADATIRPDETLKPIGNLHGLGAIEMHPTKKLDVYMYYGGEYAQRTIYTNPVTGQFFGYGTRNLNDSGCYALPAPTAVGAAGGSITAANCGSPTRYIQEGMTGFTYRVVNSPKAGRLQYQMTYSYIQRNLWSGLTSGTFGAAGATYLGPRAQENMIHASMRYYLP